MEPGTEIATTYAVVKSRDVIPVKVGGPAEGLEVAVYAGVEQGAIHLETAIAALAPGGSIGGHLHPFEESFFVLEGGGFVKIGDAHYELKAGDFGFAPVAYPHAWNNSFDAPLRWLRVRAPQLRPIGKALGTYPVPDLGPPNSGRPVESESVGQRFVGHFDDSQVPPPGPLAIAGYRGYNIRNVSIRMMVDQLLGAQQHTLFVVEFEPSTVQDGVSAKEHFHPFRRALLLRGGSGRRKGGRSTRSTSGRAIWCLQASTRRTGSPTTEMFRCAGSRPRPRCHPPCTGRSSRPTGWADRDDRGPR